LTVLKVSVLILALANAGYFLWSRGIGSSDGAADNTAAVPRLRLVSESAAALSARAVTGDSSRSAAAGAEGGSSTGSAAAAPLASNVTRCISLGPFPDVSQAVHAATALRGGGYQPRQRVAEGEVWVGVWVYLPMPPAPGAAEQMRAKLKAGGIDDALEMPGPNDTSVLSLGLYSEPKRAQARVTQAQALGYSPAVSDRKRAGDVYWLDIDLKPSDAMLNPADLQPEAGRIVRLEVKGCPMAGPTT
jgi:hypothetical protein